MKKGISRRQFVGRSAALAGLAAAGPLSPAFAARSDRMNILCWEGYNSDEVLGPFRDAHPDATVRAESGTSDPDMINKLRAGETSVWDLINVNQPWARDRLYPEKLIKPLDKDRFLPYFDKMLPSFKNPPYELSFADDGELIGMPQRYGPFSFVVNTDKISRETAEEQGWNLFLDPAMKDRYGVLTYDNWNVMHMCLTAGLNPFEPVEGDNVEKFRETARTIFGGAKLMTDDLVAMNTALINGEIDAYFTGGTYTASPARYDGATNVRAITPLSGPVDGKGGVVWIELTSLVNNPDPSDLAQDFLEFVQTPEISKAVAFTEGTYNPVSQMGDEAVMALFDADELDAIQMDSLEEEMSRSLDYQVVASYDTLIDIYTQERRS
ncbi:MULTISPECIES: ABC transporter substrate-binding protein [Roseovarius]|uniref:ABC transporter substrate-binding protein n=1 Tax=Roseovarius TaxID=74030 RepID=UPI001C94054A|nr:PotD/PotF family extracellular solute-binding protein [Roseovarius atlanticus]MBY5987719.1 PotD/PotF family extracellular solute-binding protein [Roseovarius atlanticus]MBY6123110.1 PotD/PotF family extracellular solute-binding protein [Roseovarius atlanticus]MBY6147606.1 PotD/PotF family extracellular solute-binding protein [Roseovarius atlanticus]